MKAAQLALAAELGFEIAPTLFTTAPDDLLDFHRSQSGRIVGKVAGPVFNRHYGPEIGRYTELVAPRDMVHARAIGLAPMIFQGYVDKRVELRITVVGTRAYAVEIHSQQARRTRHDWRRYDVARTPHRLHRLDPGIERRCIALTQRLGLHYGAIDMILTPDGRHVFVEINPNGQFLWLEQLTGAPIGDAIADWLSAARGPLPVHSIKAYA
jgi:hypothetical protein